MPIWSAEIKELEKLYESFRGQLPELEKELEKLIKADDENMILLYSRRCLEVIITDLCECELKRPRKTEPLKGIIDKLHKEEIVPSHIITSIHGLNELSTYGAHPKDFDPEQVKPVLNNLDIIIKWYLKFQEGRTEAKARPVEEIRLESKESGEPKKSAAAQKKRLTGLISSLILLIAIVVVVLSITGIIGGGRQKQEREKSIAVLPFVNDSPDQERMYFINGLMEAILDNLCKIEDLSVRSRTTVEQYRDNPESIPTIAKKLNVNYILEGSGHRDGNKVKLFVQLLDGRKDKHLWSYKYDSNIDEVFSLVSEIAQLVATKSEAIITPEEKQLIDKNPTSSIPAYNSYIKANDFLKEYGKNKDISDYYTSVNLYRDALKEDSTFARAYSGLANAFMIRYQWEDFFKEDYLDSMLTLIDKALSIDDKLDEAYYLKGKYYMAKGEFDMAITHFDNALKYNPNYLAVYLDKGYILTWLSIDFIKCIDNYNNALNLCGNNDRPLLLRALGHIYQDIGLPDKAKYYYDQAFVIDSGINHRLGELAEFAFYSGNIEEGLRIEREIAKKNSTYFPFELMMLGDVVEEAYLLAKRLEDQYKKSGELNLQASHRIGYAFNRAGKEKEAKYYFDQQIKFSEEALRLNRRQSRSNAAIYDLAATYAFLGEKEKAYKYLHEFERRSNFSLWWILYLKYDPLFYRIRNDPEFQDIVKDTEAKYQAEHERVRKWLEKQGML